MPLDDEQSRRATRYGVFTSTAVLGVVCLAACVGVHTVSLYGVPLDAQLRGVRYWHLFVPLLFAGPPLIYFHHLRRDTWTAAHRSWPGWARGIGLGTLVYAAFTVVMVVVVLGGGVPMQEAGVYWLGYPDTILRHVSEREYHLAVAQMWQMFSALGIALYYFLTLYAWQFRRDSASRFREIRLWRGRD